MNIFLVTKQPLDGRGKFNDAFIASVASNLLYRGLDYYIRLLRLSRYGVDGWGSPDEVDRMDAEIRAQLFPYNSPLSA